MFILPGILALVAFIFARPFDFIPALRGVPFLYIFFALAVFGYAVDIRLGLTRVKLTPQLGWAVAFILWCLLTALIKAPTILARGAVHLMIAFVLFFLVAHGLRSFKAFESFAAVILACGLCVSAVVVHQGLSPFQCVAVAPGDDHTVMGKPDGRPCQSIPECEINPPDPEALYRCERVGIFGVTSIARGRARYVGVLHDPNEMAMAVSCVVPFAFGFYQRRRSGLRLGLLLLALALAGAAVVLSRSRGGQLVFMAALAVYFVKRFGWKGIVAGVVAAVPVLLLGGRGGQSAGASSTERLECWYAGLQMFQSWPVLGAGFGQFTQHHHLTAHNSFLLAASELGVLGMMLWSALVYLSVKIAWTALRTLGDIAEAEAARVWALALLSAMAAMMVGIFFLSFNYHFILWIYLGICGALYSAVKRHLPRWKVPFGWKDLLLIAVGNAAHIAALFVYTRVALG